MTHSFDITIIIPLYNKDYSIERTLKSIIFQSILPKKIVIINDGSTDNSLETCRNFIKDNQYIFNNYVLVNRENKGVSYSRNEGLNYVKTRYLTFIDADDEFLPGYFEKRINDVSNNCCSIFTGSHFVNHKLIKNPFINKSMIVKLPYFFSIFNSILNSSKTIFDLSKIDLHELKFPENAVVGEDLYLWLILMNKHTIYYDIEPFVKINYVSDKSRGFRKCKLPYPILRYKDFKKYPFSCKLYVHLMLLKHLRGNFRCISSYELSSSFFYTRILNFFYTIYTKFIKE